MHYLCGRRSGGRATTSDGLKNGIEHLGSKGATVGVSQREKRGGSRGGKIYFLKKGEQAMNVKAEPKKMVLGAQNRKGRGEKGKERVISGKEL